MKKLVLLITLMFFLVAGVFAQQKYALVIGNGNYVNTTKLSNPVNDANDMAVALQGLGWSVDKLLNGTQDQMVNSVMQLKRRLSASRESYGFLFYAGHGIQSGGENYLIPVDANIPSENFLRNRTVSVQEMLDELNDAGNEFNIIVLDACRDNPFSWKRSGSRGLSVIGSQPADSILVFATAAGSTAADGNGRNGLFTSYLLNNLKQPDLEVTEVFRRTGADVAKASNNQQRPAVYNQFYGTAYLGKKPQPATQTASVAQQPAPTPSVQPTQTAQVATTAQSVLTAQLQTILNSMPAIPIAGNSLKFQFNGDKWTALLNGENFSTGNIEIENTANGSLLTLKQTHIYPGAAMKTAGKVASLVPGGAAVGGALNTAGQVAGAVGQVAGPVEAAGQAIVLEYIAGPSPKLTYVKSLNTSASASSVNAAVSSANASVSRPRSNVAPAVVSGLFLPEGWKSNTGPLAFANINLEKDIIDGMEKDILIVEAKIDKGDKIGSTSWVGIKTSEEQILSRLNKGIRFKVIGEGDSWAVVFITSSGQVKSYSSYSRVNFSTKKGKIVQVDIPLSKVNGLPSGSRGEITTVGIEKAPGTGVGLYNIKIFDVEVY